MGFYVSPLGYLEKGASRFVHVTGDPQLMIKPMDNGQSIINSKNEKVWKQNKQATMRKTRLDNLCFPVRAFATRSIALLLSCSAPVFCSRSLAPLSSCLKSSTCLSSLFACSGILTALSSRLLLASVSRSLAILLFLPVLDSTPLDLASTVSKHLNKPCQKSLYAIQLAIQSLFVCFLIFARCPTKPTASKLLLKHPSILAYLSTIILEKRLTLALQNVVSYLQWS